MAFDTNINLANPRSSPAGNSVGQLCDENMETLGGLTSLVQDGPTRRRTQRLQSERKPTAIAQEETEVTEGMLVAFLPSAGDVARPRSVRR
jgi:hypothetical protein